MSTRTVIVLAVALVALVLLAIFGQRTGTPSSGSGDLLVPGLTDTLGEIERVTIVKANGETVATLERRPDEWIVADKHGYVASATKLRQALTGLAEARILEQKTANAELYSRLGVEDVAGAEATGLSVTLTAPGRELPTIILGNAEGAKYRYARRAGEAQSVLIDRNPDFPRSAAQWVDTVIVDVRGDRVRQATITHADGEVVSISKTGPELTNFEVAAIPTGRELSYPGVANTIGNALRELNLEDVEPAGLNPPVDPTIVEYRTFDGLVVRITGVKRNDESWVSFEASVDAEQAAQAAAPPPAEPAAPAADGAAPAAAPAAATPDPAAEAESINAKVGGWRYKIAGFQYDQMTRRMADLLKAPLAP
jgi:cell division septation protein DedD